MLSSFKVPDLKTMSSHRSKKMGCYPAFWAIAATIETGDSDPGPRKRFREAAASAREQILDGQQLYAIFFAKSEPPHCAHTKQPQQGHST